MSLHVSSIARAVPTADGGTVLEVGGRPFFQLNPLAAAIWAELTQGLPTQEIVRRLTAQFDVPEERVSKDVEVFVGLLKQNNLVKDSGGTKDFNVELLWNKGIAARCDWRIPDEFPSETTFNTILDPVGHIAPPNLLDNLIPEPELYSRVKDGELVWVRLSWIRSFVRQALPRIKAKFVLVTADSDVSVPTPIMAEAMEILERSEVIHWYAQNCDGPGFLGRMSPLPIGMDFHTLSDRPLWGEDMASPQEQEQTLRVIRGGFPPATERIRKVYVDFAWQPVHLYRPFKRQQILAKILANENVVFQSRPIPRSQLWGKWGEYAFVLSPHGIGLDCHRTWEALACGNIVLVPSSPLDSLYEGLPVIPIKDWSEITLRNLDAWVDRFTGCEVTERRLTNTYWLNKMRTTAKEEIDANRHS